MTRIAAFSVMTRPKAAGYLSLLHGCFALLKSLWHINYILRKCHSGHKGFPLCPLGVIVWDFTSIKGLNSYIISDNENIKILKGLNNLKSAKNLQTSYNEKLKDITALKKLRKLGRIVISCLNHLRNVFCITHLRFRQVLLLGNSIWIDVHIWCWKSK